MNYRKQFQELEDGYGASSRRFRRRSAELREDGRDEMAAKFDLMADEADADGRRVHTHRRRKGWL
jgi:hypothetical protein